MRPATLFSGIFCLTVLAGLVAGALWAHARLQAKDDVLRALVAKVEHAQVQEAIFEEERSILIDQVMAVERERDAALAQGDALRDDIKAMERRMIETMVPREIMSSADFPVERAMGNGGERLSDFAARERTSVAVLKALNPRLDESAPLKPFQVLWIPKKSGARPR